MALEIEAKLKVESHEKIVKALISLGAEYKHTLRQGDLYFDNESSCLVKNDKCLRLRFEENLDENTNEIAQSADCVLCFKGPKGNGIFKSREEIETSVGSLVFTRNILEQLGYSVTLAFDKKRQLWRIDECDVCLDELPIVGKYVEIEGPNEETVRSVQFKLGLESFAHEHKSYACLIDASLNCAGIVSREVYLDERK